MKSWETLLQALCAAGGIPGRESDLHPVLRAALPDAVWETTPTGDLLATVCPTPAGGETLLLEAHADRIGLVVCGYEKDGFVRVAKAGGPDPSCLMGSELEIETRDGRRIPAVVGAPFPYPARPHNSAPASEYKMPEHTALWVDTGLDDPASVIPLGAPVYAAADFRRLAGNRVSGPALDNRAGCAVLIEAARRLAGCTTPVGVKLLFSSREEIGCHGARTGSFAADAQRAIVVDAGFALSPDVPEREASELGKGPEIGLSAVLDREWTDRLIETAARCEIPVQTLVLPGRGTGTDADVIAVSGRGVRTALLSIPVRFMHHPAEVADCTDMEAAAALLAAVAKEKRV